MNYFFKEMDSPVGLLRLVGSDRGLAAVLWEDDDPNRVRVKDYVRDDNHPVLLDAEKQLKEYFAGSRKEFALKLSLGGVNVKENEANAKQLKMGMSD
jgi:methylated-DNA-[protein]-cysteine S-methyltransferase